MQKPPPPAAPRQPAPPGNQKLWLGVGIGALLTLIFMLTYEGYLPLTTSFLTGVLFTVVLILLLSVLGAHLFRHRFLKKWFGTEGDVEKVLEDLKQGVHSVSTFITDAALSGMEAEKKKDIRLLVPKFVQYLLFSQFRTWGMRLALMALAALGSILGAMLLFHQNQLLQKQNEKIDRQIQLEEASRRSSLNFLLANVLDKMDAELKEADRQGKPRRLSPQMIGRIASISQSYKPYRFMDGDTLIADALSPERGNLLLAISNSNLDTLTLDRVFEKTVFHAASLDGAVLDSACLRGADLAKSNLDGAALDHASLRRANLVAASLAASNLNDADLSDAMLTGASLTLAVLRGTRMDRVNLLEAEMMETDMTAASLKNANLGGADLSRAICKGANFSGAYLTGVNFTGANLQGATLVNADLSGSSLANADLSGSDLTGAKLNFTAQLRAAKSLFNTKGIPVDALNELQKNNPALFKQPAGKGQ